ncbi:hypothetical protein L598_002500000490 [Mesorhizobium sp. J18]|uniref:class I SAM-dependent methyltransferase n=1 Tax=Mesorhizobium sp. J18 TaxID=935263 RepID=UPI00119AA9E6|nr:class I SAM-dependent methyltransferase [Mesorhizobium sp. J18]TWG96741.1 hypothetical protein L598_002500000490 [Mesorhizobium sp. J18]
MPMRKRARLLKPLSQKIARKLRQDGLCGLFRQGLNEAGIWFRGRGRILPQDSFDNEYGTDTGGVIPLWKLQIDSPHSNEGVRYQTLEAGLLRELIGSLPIRHEDFVYVDLGSGKGRSLLIASEYPFRKVIGVEFSQELDVIANRNILRYRPPNRRCGNVSSICVDAADFRFPPDRLVVFLYNPFGTGVLSRVLENLERTLHEHRREVWILYSNPVHADLLDGAGFLDRENLALPDNAAVYKTGN